jgi:Tfp pilus assembly protein PilN
MKININILPDEQKEKRGIENKIGAVGRFGSSLIFVLLFLTAVLFCAKLVLNINFRSVEDSANDHPGVADEEMKQTEAFLNEVNASTHNISNISSNTPRWSKVLKKMSDISPPDMRISLIHVEGVHIKLQGFSKSREAFLDFQEKLKTEGYKNINSPLSNLVSPKNFNFEIEMDVDSKYLNQN